MPMSHPTPEQIAALKRLQIEVNKLYTYTQSINALIDSQYLEADLGINRLPYFPLSLTSGAASEVLRRHELREAQKARAA